MDHIKQEFVSSIVKGPGPYSQHFIFSVTYKWVFIKASDSDRQHQRHKLTTGSANFPYIMTLKCFIEQAIVTVFTTLYFLRNLQMGVFQSQWKWQAASETLAYYSTCQFSVHYDYKYKMFYSTGHCDCIQNTLFSP